ncbi:MAG: DUF4132 domain-containing protein [Sandaracinus sp.]|nr:DUF4132 domain-containing protein [Sandaracinus sp.]MCB9613242.1 DUF4132 domain-containing protein [Sandaracinus sp.]
MRGLGGAAYGLEPTVATMLGLLREHACSPLTAMLKSADSADATKVVVDALSRIGTPDAIEVLAKQADRRECVAGVAEAARRFPRVALGVLAGVATSRSKASDAAQTLLKATLRRDGEALEDVIAALPEASLKLCRKLLADTAPKEQASMNELPEVLAKPRWEGKRKAGPPTLKNLPEVAPPPASVWPEGLREKWKEHLKLRSWDEVAKSLRFDPSMKRFVMDGDEKGHSDAIQAYKKVSYLWGGHLLALGPRPVLRLARVGDSSRWYMNESDLLGFAGQFDLESLDFLLWWAGSHPAHVMPALLPFADARIAPIAAAGIGKKTVRADAEAWLAAHPLHAAAGLLPVAFGKAGKARDAALAGLRFLIARGDRPAIEEAARSLGDAAVAGLEAVFGFDELDLLPSKMPSLPSFFVADALSPPLLKNGKALPTVAVERLGTMLSLSKEVTEPYAGVALVKEACTAESLAAFSWDLFQAWSVAGYPSKEQWAFVQLGWLGDDECARRLAPQLRVWPGESAHARAVVGLDVLMGIGSDVALMHLNGIAEKLKFKGLQEKAREKIAAIAEARGLTAVELADRLVPDLGLDDDGSLELDFGDRRFRVGFDEALKPFVRDSDGKVLSDLPKPKKTDDAEKSKAATDMWKALKKDARTIAGQQVARLELAMVDRRRWPLTTFRTFLVEHPLVGHLVRRLVWGVYEVEVPKDGSPAGGTLKQAFRVAEDRSFANTDDDSFELGDEVWIGVVHPLELAPGDAAAFGQVFADYEILQPFVQLGRDLHTLTPDEAKAKELKRVEGAKVPTGRVLGLESRGWRRGDPQDGGGIWWMERRLPGLTLTAVLELDPGIVVGDVSMFPEQTLRTVYISNVGYVWRRERVSTLDEVPAIAMSELLRDLEALRS